MQSEPTKPSPQLTVLISARRNSKYLAKFLFGLAAYTSNPDNLEVMVMLNAHDDWNNELEKVASQDLGIKFFRENYRLGRAGLHEYFNTMLPTAKGDWFIYFCEDHFITTPGWDQYIMDHINGIASSGDSAGKEFPLDPNKIWVLVPKFDNCGAMNHVVSKGFISALNGRIGNHGWIDSYINDLMHEFPDRTIRFDTALFHDFTHDQPNPMSDAHMQAVDPAKGQALPGYEDPLTKRQLKKDMAKIAELIKRGKA